MDEEPDEEPLAVSSQWDRPSHCQS